MRHLKCLTLIAILMLGCVQSALRAQDLGNGPVNPPSDDPPYTIGSGWAQFSWTNGPNVFNVEGPYTFNASGPVTLDVTDWRYDGDRFKIFDNGLLIGTTSMPTDNGFTIFDDADAAFVDSRFSHGTFNLGPGAHALTFETILVATCYPDGVGNFRVESSPEIPSAVPVPTSILGGSVLLLSLLVLRRRSILAA